MVSWARRPRRERNSLDIKRSEILEALHAIQKKPGMFLRNYNNYEKYAAYLDGFILGIGIFHDKNYLREISQWCDKESSIAFSDAIALSYKDHSDEIKREMLIQTLIEYFEGAGHDGGDEAGEGMVK